MNGGRSRVALYWSELEVSPDWYDSVVACGLRCEEYVPSVIFVQVACVCGRVAKSSEQAERVVVAASDISPASAIMSCDCGWTSSKTCASSDGTHCWAVCCGGQPGGNAPSSSVDGGLALGLIRGGGSPSTCDTSDGAPLAIFVALLVGGLLNTTGLIVVTLIKAPKGVAASERPADVDQQWRLPLLGMGAASLVIVVTCARASMFDYIDAYCLGSAACAFSLVPLIASALLLLLSHAGWLSYDAIAMHSLSLSIGRGFAYFLCAWWAAATIVMTFVGPFEITSNPYFACWAAFLCACRLLSPGTTAEEGAASARAAVTDLILLLIAAILVCGQSVDIFDSAREARWALVIACLTALAVGLLLLRPQLFQPVWRSALLIVLLLLWVMTCWLTTSYQAGGPFVVTGNGYFGAWLGVGSALHAVLHDGGSVTVNAINAGAAPERRTLFLLGIASLIVTIEASRGREGRSLYAFCVGGISLGFVLLVALLRALHASEAAALLESHACTVCQRTLSKEGALAAFLTLWWVAGAGVLTFDAPFTVTSNAYFACWAALFFSGSHLMLTVQVAADGAAAAATAASGERRWYLGLLVASIAMFGACLAISARPSEAKYALACSGVTAAITMALLLLPPASVAPAARAALSVLLFGLWVAAVYLTTFGRGPFVLTGNGFFSAWLGVVSASCLALSEASTLQALLCPRKGTPGATSQDGPLQREDGAPPPTTTTTTTTQRPAARASVQRGSVKRGSVKEAGYPPADPGTVSSSAPPPAEEHLELKLDDVEAPPHPVYTPRTQPSWMVSDRPSAATEPSGLAWEGR